MNATSSTITSSAITGPTIPWTTSDRSAVRTRSDDVRSVRAALRSERIKLTALRANKVILALTSITGAVIAGVLAATTTDPALTASELFIYPLPLVAMLASVVGILMFTGEAQHGTLAVALVARPARWVIVAAKTITATTTGLALGTAGMIAGFAGAVVGGVPLGTGSALTSRALWALLYIALAALIGLGVGMIARHTAGAITGLLLWSFVIESLFAPAIPQDVRHFLPFSAGYRLLDAGPNFESPVAIADLLARPQYALIFGGYALVSLTIGTVLLYRRDTN
jgi:ABC-2 type transport system permease protein